MPARPAPAAFYTPAEVATLFRVSPKTVARWATQGKLSVSRTPGGHRRYDSAEVDLLFAVLTQPATEPAGRAL